MSHDDAPLPTQARRPPPDPSAKPEPRDEVPSHRRTLARVLLVQAATMILLWLLQVRYHG